MPFYKVENDKLISADNIDGLDYSLNENSKSEYIYPVDGWEWHNDIQSAMSSTGKAPE